jgi:hypothetical protein
LKEKLNKAFLENILIFQANLLVNYIKKFNYKIKMMIMIITKITDLDIIW